MFYNKIEMINHDKSFKRLYKNGWKTRFIGNICSLCSYVKFGLLHYDITILYLDFFKFVSENTKNLLDYIVASMCICGPIVLMQKKGYTQQKNEIKECDECAAWVKYSEK